jgi:hypothetical protein
MGIPAMAEEKSRTMEDEGRRGSISAATVTQALSGVDFPKRKDDLKEYAKRRTLDAGLNGVTEVLNVLDRLQDREYRNMADVERSVGQIL